MNIEIKKYSMSDRVSVFSTTDVGMVSAAYLHLSRNLRIKKVYRLVGIEMDERTDIGGTKYYSITVPPEAFASRKNELEKLQEHMEGFKEGYNSIRASGGRRA